jgi:hypothetical protein
MRKTQEDDKSCHLELIRWGKRTERGESNVTQTNVQNMSQMSQDLQLESGCGKNVLSELHED